MEEPPGIPERLQGGCRYIVTAVATDNKERGSAQTAHFSSSIVSLRHSSTQPLRDHICLGICLYTNIVIIREHKYVSIS